MNAKAIFSINKVTNNKARFCELFPYLRSLIGIMNFEEIDIFVDYYYCDKDEIVPTGNALRRCKPTDFQTAITGTFHLAKAFFVDDESNTFFKSCTIKDCELTINLVCFEGEYKHKLFSNYSTTTLQEIGIDELFPCGQYKVSEEWTKLIYSEDFCSDNTSDYPNLKDFERGDA